MSGSDPGTWTPGHAPMGHCQLDPDGLVPEALLSAEAELFRAAEDVRGPGDVLDREADRTHDHEIVVRRAPRVGPRHDRPERDHRVAVQDPGRLGPGEEARRMPGLVLDVVRDEEVR